MTLFQAFILGLIQAFTEFFPVSSSAHLKLTKILLGIEPKEDLILFDLSCHLGTLIAIIYFFRLEIMEICKDRGKKFLQIFVALLPLIPAYFLLKPVREFASNTAYLGYCLIATGLILFAGHFFKIPRKQNQVAHSKLKDAFCIGMLQSIALIPGISRSGSTIACASILGWEPIHAVRFSFLLSIPTVLGGNTLELTKAYFSHTPVWEGGMSMLILGFFTSLIVGLIVIKFAMKILEKGNLRPFAYYCIALGLFTFFLTRS
jgi:undecaprenyl-diphosphatase